MWKGSRKKKKWEGEWRKEEEGDRGEIYILGEMVRRGRHRMRIERKEQEGRVIGGEWMLGKAEG